MKLSGFPCEAKDVSDSQGVHPEKGCGLGMEWSAQGVKDLKDNTGLRTQLCVMDVKELVVRCYEKIFRDCAGEFT